MRQKILSISVAGHKQDLSCSAAEYSREGYEPTRQRKYYETLNVAANRKGILVTAEDFDVMFYCDHNFEDGIIRGCESLVYTVML